MVDRTPKVVCFAVDTHKHLVQVPASVRVRSPINTSCSDLCCENWPEPVPPEPNRFVADVNAAFKQEVFDLTERQRIAHVHHHREADDLWRTVEISEGISHSSTLCTTGPRLKLICSDNALRRNTACGSGGGYPEPSGRPHSLRRLISVSSAFPSVTTMSQKSSVIGPCFARNWRLKVHASVRDLLMALT